MNLLFCNDTEKYLGGGIYEKGCYSPETTEPWILINLQKSAQIYDVIIYSPNHPHMQVFIVNSLKLEFLPILHFLWFILHLFLYCSLSFIFSFIPS